MSSFIFVRHGESEANAAHQIATKETKLTDSGIEQARKAGIELRKFGITYIVCSPLIRAQQTAEIIAAEVGVPLKDIKIIPELEERDLGNCKGLLKTHDNSYYLFKDSDHDRMESTSDLINRMQRALIVISNLSMPEGTLLVVGHAVSGYYLYQVAKGASSLADFDRTEHLSNAKYVEIEAK